MQLNQFYTQSQYSDLLIGSLNLEMPLNVVDLGFGDGELLRAASRRWNGLSLIGVDIDSGNVKNANSQNLIQAVHHDGFNPVLPQILNDKYGEIDVLVSNPPYFAKEVDKNILSILSEAGMADCISKKCKKIPAELVFLAQNLRLLSLNGELGIILPAGLISGERWRGVREFLLSVYYVRECIQLPIGSFNRTDAQAFILIISKKTSHCPKYLKLSHAAFSQTIEIDLKKAAHRSDYLYYYQTNSTKNPNRIQADDISILRGNLPHKTLKAEYEDYIHTSQLPLEPTVIDLPYSPTSEGNNAVCGDILLARVGRRCIGRVALVRAGTLPVSDCIIIVRAVNQTIRSAVWAKFSAPHAKLTMQNWSLGVGAKYITHSIVKEYLLDV